MVGGKRGSIEGGGGGEGGGDRDLIISFRSFFEGVGKEGGRERGGFWYTITPYNYAYPFQKINEER